MKTLKSIVLGLALLTVFGAANAAGKPEKLSKDYVISTYINALSHGKLDGVKDVLDQNAKLSMLQGATVISYTKEEMLNYMETNRNVEQNCTVSTSELESNDNVSIVKVSMKYDGFVRSSYITVANTGDGWKITDVYSI